MDNEAQKDLSWWQKNVQPCQCWLYSLPESVAALKKRIIQGANPIILPISVSAEGVGMKALASWDLAIWRATSCVFRLPN